MVNYPSGWEKKKLKDVANYRNGKAHEKNVVEQGKYIIVNAKFISTEGEVIKYCDEQIEPLFEDEIAIVLSDIPNGRALGKTYLVKKNDKYSLNQRIAGLTPHNDINSYFLAKLMNRNAYFLSFNDGINQTNLSVKNVMNFSARYPTLDEQKAIADTLMSFDEHIDNLIKLIEKKKIIRDGAIEDLVTGKKRLDGFDGEWEEKELGKILEYEQPQDYIVKSTKYSTEFKIPVLTAGQSLILGYTSENFGIKEATRENPVIIFDDFTTSTQFIRFSFKVKSSALKLLSLNDKNNNIYFMYNLLKGLSYKVETHERHWISQFARYKVLVPFFEEQQAIAELLTVMDDEIISLEKELDKMKQIREGAMDDLLTGRVRLEV